MSKWIEFIPSVPTPKTKTWRVVVKDSGDMLGRVAWYGAWRRYCFFPVVFIDTVFEEQCLRDIAEFVEQQSNARRKAREFQAKERG